MIRLDSMSRVPLSTHHRYNGQSAPKAEIEIGCGEEAMPGDYRGESSQLGVEGKKFLSSFSLPMIFVLPIPAALFNRFACPLLSLRPGACHWPCMATKRLKIEA